MKVLIISDYREIISTRPEAFTMIGMAKLGLDITIMTYPDAYWIPEFTKAGIRIIDFHPQKKMDKKEISVIRKELIDGQYDILHLFNSVATLNGIQAARGLKTRIFLYRGYVGNIHWWDPTAYLKHLSPHVDKIWCIAPGVSDYLNRQFIFRPHKAVSITKGHDPSWYTDVKKADLSEWGIPENAYVAAMVANARPMKGLPYLIKATYHLPPDMPFYLLLIGRGLDTPAIRKWVDKSPFKDRIVFTGFRSDAMELVKASSIYVLSSIYGEAINKSVIEAMSLGVTPVITDIVGNHDLVEDGKSGLVVPKANPVKMAQAISRLYNEPELRLRFSQEAPIRMKEKFHVMDTARNLKQLYEEVALSQK
jgi:glycosyltransferase involved in cell wall biosynthesis